MSESIEELYLRRLREGLSAENIEDIPAQVWTQGLAYIRMKRSSGGQSTGEDALMSELVRMGRDRIDRMRETGDAPAMPELDDGPDAATGYTR